MSKDEVMNRRNFFRRGFGKVASFSTDYVEHKVVEKAKAWIRPPFAKTELDFLVSCSRCGDCIDACPHQVIFPLPLKRGASVAGTPAMDIPNNACLLCTDWACVTACKDKALSFISNQVADNKITITDKVEGTVVDEKTLNLNPSEVFLGDDTDSENTEPNITDPENMPQAKDCPPMASARIDESLCMPYSGPECGACKGSCPLPDTLVWHNEKPSINLDNCIGCGQCVQLCITSPKAIKISQYMQPIEQI